MNREFLKEVSDQLQNEARVVNNQCRQLIANGNPEGAELLALNANLLMYLSKVATNLAAEPLKIIV